MSNTTEVNYINKSDVLKIIDILDKMDEIDNTYHILILDKIDINLIEKYVRYKKLKNLNGNNA